MATPPPPHLVPAPRQQADEDTGQAPVLRMQFRGTKWLARLNAAGLLVALAAVGVTSDKVKSWLVRDAVAQDAGVQALEKRITVQEKAFEQHMLDDAQAKRQQQADNYELRNDVKALYESVMTGKKSERLERPIPPPDGGTR